MPPKSKSQPPLGEQIIDGLTSFRDTLKDDQLIDEHFTVRTVELDLEPHPYTAEEVRRVRLALPASQAVFAKILGVSPSTLQSWEQGKKQPQPIACRFLDEIQADHERWRQLLRNSIIESG